MHSVPSSLRLQEISGGGGLKFGWCAARDSQCQPIFSEDNRFVQLSGIILDTIDRAGGLFKVPESVVTGFSESGTAVSHAELSSGVALFAQWADLAKAFQKNKTYITGESQLDAFWQTIIAGHHIPTLARMAEAMGDSNWTAEYSQEVMRGEFLGYWNDASPIRRAKQIPCPKWLGSLALGIAWAWSGAASLFRGRRNVKGRLWSAMTAISRNRKLVLTRCGYLSLVHGLAEPGDVIVILDGGDTPFVIRKREENWELIGECYVHGVMNGEAYGADNRGTFVFM